MFYVWCACTKLSLVNWQASLRRGREYEPASECVSRVHRDTFSHCCYKVTGLQGLAGANPNRCCTSFCNGPIAETPAAPRPSAVRPRHGFSTRLRACPRGSATPPRGSAPRLRRPPLRRAMSPPLIPRLPSRPRRERWPEFLATCWPT